MLLIAFRNLFQEKTRLLISVGGVSFAIVLMLVLSGIFYGAVEQNSRLIDRNPADLYLFPAGSRDFAHGMPALGLDVLDRIRCEPGVRDAVPALEQRLTIETPDRSFRVFLSTFEAGKPEGRPWEIGEGDDHLGQDGILLSQRLARQLGKRVGDTISFAGWDRKWRIAGLVPGATNFNNNYAWITWEEAQDALGTVGAASSAYVSLQDPRQEQKILQRLQAKYPSVSVFDKATMSRKIRAEIEHTFLPVLQATVALAMLIGTAVIGLTIYTATLDKAREAGILKAIGVANGQLYSIVLAQSLATTVSGTAAGIAIALVVGQRMEAGGAVPFAVHAPQIATVAGIGLLMAVLASLLPVRRLVSLDPAVVFKS